jgi:hypothetical protein
MKTKTPKEMTEKQKNADMRSYMGILWILFLLFLTFIGICILLSELGIW